MPIGNQSAAPADEKKPAPTALPDPDHEALRQALFADGAAGQSAQDEVRKIHARHLDEGAAPFRNQIEALNWTHPGVPPRAMALADRANPHNSPRLHSRQPRQSRPGSAAPFSGSAERGQPAPFTNGSGRLELAQAIASRDNPLTARVFVNRVWRHHFGAALVRTPSDFGVRTEAAGATGAARLPRRLVHGRRLVHEETAPADRALHHLPAKQRGQCRQSQGRSRQSLSSTHQPPPARFRGDARHAAGGVRQARPDGWRPAGGYSRRTVQPRRTVYGLIDRQNLPGLFRTFDFANPDASSPGRFATTVPQQALFMMNSPFVIEQARSLVARPEVKQATSDPEKIQTLSRLAWQRPAERNEIRTAESFLALPPPSGATLSPLEKYAQVLLLSNELGFVD